MNIGKKPPRNIEVLLSAEKKPDLIFRRKMIKPLKIEIQKRSIDSFSDYV